MGYSSALRGLLRALFGRRPRVGERWVLEGPGALISVVTVHEVSWWKVAYVFDVGLPEPETMKWARMNYRSLFFFKSMYRRET